MPFVLDVDYRLLDPSGTTVLADWAPVDELDLGPIERTAETDYPVIEVVSVLIG